MFYFAWVDKSEITFNPLIHCREDEEVFTLNITHAEGDFPAMSIQITNPRVGLLTGARKQWAWVSYRDKLGNVTPLFFGRLLGVPQAIQDNVVGLMFVARPADYEEQRAAVADSLRVLPYFDPVWIGGDGARDPDAVLEGYTRIWHIDRITHEVTTSDIIQDVGETVVAYGDADDVFRESVNVSHGQSPVRRVVVTAAVEWGQSAVGTVDISNALLNAFAGETPVGLATISGMERSTKGMINVICGDDLLSKWPTKGDSVGSGWSIGDTSLTIVGGYPLPPTLTDSDTMIYLRTKTWHDSVFGTAIRTMFERTPGLAIEVIDYEDSNIGKDNTVNGGKITASGKFNILWVPIFRMAAGMKMDYDISRARTESIGFEVNADVQPLLSDPGDEETIYLDIGTANVDVPIDGVIPINTLRNNRYFETDRGHLSFEHLLCRARAILVSRARAVDVSFTMPFEKGLDLSCRRTVTLLDPRLPEGQATGKIKQYVMTADGSSGNAQVSVVIGCAIGRGGSPAPAPGTPTYADDYVVGYQAYLGTVIVPPVADVSYPEYNGYAIEDDGVNLISLDLQSALLSIDVEGGLIKESEAANGSGNNSTGVEVMDRVASASTTLRIEMLPLAGGPFDTVMEVAIDPLHIPRMINLEADD